MLNFLAFENFFKFDFKYFTGENLVSYMVMLVVIFLSFIIYFTFRKKDPTKPEKGFAMIVVLAVEKLDAMVEDIMGKKYQGFGGYVLGLALYIGLSFFVSLMGLPGPMTNLGNTFAMGLWTFILIHATAVRANHWKYFKRYIEPSPVMLPINLLSMWAPLLSISLRIFGNALSGFTLMAIVYWALGKLSFILFGGFLSAIPATLILPPFITPALHAYFDVFSGLIQTLIFMMLTMIQVAQEDPDPALA